SAAICWSVRESMERMSTAKSYSPPPRWGRVGVMPDAKLTSNFTPPQSPPHQREGRDSPARRSRPGGYARRRALVPQQDRQLQWSEVAGKGADRLRSRTVASVHVEWKADDEAARMLML